MIKNATKKNHKERVYLLSLSQLYSNTQAVVITNVSQAQGRSRRQWKDLPGIFVGPWSPSSGNTILVPARIPGLIGIVKIFSIDNVVDLSSPTKTNFWIFIFFIPPKNTYDETFPAVWLWGARLHSCYLQRFCTLKHTLHIHNPFNLFNLIFLSFCMKCWNQNLIMLIIKRYREEETISTKNMQFFNNFVNEKYTKEKIQYTHILICMTDLRAGIKEEEMIYNYRSVLTSERVKNKFLIRGSSFCFIPRPSGNSSRGWGSVRIFRRSSYGLSITKNSLMIKFVDGH